MHASKDLLLFLQSMFSTLTDSGSQFLKCSLDVFSMSSCMATSRLVHNGGYIQTQLQLLNSPEILQICKTVPCNKGLTVP